MVERAVGLAALRLGSYGAPLDDRGLAQERASNALTAIAGGEDAAAVGDQVLARDVPDRAVRRLLGRAMKRILDAIRDGWCELALEALATGRVVEVEVELPPEVDDVGAVRQRASEGHRGLVETRVRPERIAPGRWRVRMRPWGTC